jgi:hypothetical protein
LAPVLLDKNNFLLHHLTTLTMPPPATNQTAIEVLVKFEGLERDDFNDIVSAIN